MYRNITQQRCIGLPAAIFVITLMVTIAAGINLLLVQNSETFEEEILLTRAFYAAESGAGFAMNTLFTPVEFPSYSARASCNAGPWAYEFTVPGLSLCRADVTCELDATVDGQDYFTVTSVGACEDVSRTVQVRTSYSAP
jgi:MSHA biogenesis protein MshP